ncbi:hypothetical protein QQF64_033350 [Cirrhinus molitorella]|uniref:Uncharacterized protein n=1 Tax=Cirrhinus molitorella TaxID=172907 RepID=A0ABR3MTL7_9TELE
MSPHRASLPAPNHQGKRKQRQPCDTLFCPPGTCSQAKPPLRTFEGGTVHAGRLSGERRTLAITHTVLERLAQKENRALRCHRAYVLINRERETPYLVCVLFYYSKICQSGKLN